MAEIGEPQPSYDQAEQAAEMEFSPTDTAKLRADSDDPIVTSGMFTPHDD